MSEVAFEEVSVLSSIYCGEGEFQLIHDSVQDGVMLQITKTVGGEGGLDFSLSFHLHPHYPSRPPEISVTSTQLSKTQCHNIRQKLIDQAAALAPEPMVHQLVECVQEYVEVLDKRSGKKEVEQVDKGKEWTVVLLLDHIRSRKHYIKLLERWTRQLQLFGMLLLGRSILVILHGDKPKIKEFCHLLKTVKIDVDSSGKKCKERMMKVLIETSSFSSCISLQGFVVKDYGSLQELSAAFQDINMKELFQQIALFAE